MGSTQSSSANIDKNDGQAIAKVQGNSYTTINYGNEARSEDNQTKDLDDCLKSLAFKEMEYRVTDVASAADGTCSWLLEHEKYVKWRSEDRGMLWIKGKPGAGKSTLLKYALNDLSQSRNQSMPKVEIISFFFHGRGNELQKTPLGLFRFMTRELLHRFPNQLLDIIEVFKRKKSASGSKEGIQWFQQELRDLLTTCICKILDYSALRIVVDALDECGDKAAVSLVDDFERLLLKCSSAPNGLSLLFTCRHYPITRSLGGDEICVEVENNRDIREYVNLKLHDGIQDDQELKEIQDVIIKQSSGVFQWVTLVLPNILQRGWDGASLLDIKEEIENTPEELDRLYDDIVQKLVNKERPRSLQLVQWIHCARRPLSLGELRWAMVVGMNPSYTSLEDCKLSKDFVQDDKKMERRVISLSGGLAEVKQYNSKSAVQFVHQSVNDYFFRTGFQKLNSSLEPNVQGIGKIHNHLSGSCLRYIAMIDYTAIESQRDDTLYTKFPLLEYA
ncbi:hypothetical protein FQN57_003787, partial [Myotisia sp. PD_48]